MIAADERQALSVRKPLWAIAVLTVVLAACGGMGEGPGPGTDRTPAVSGVTIVDYGGSRQVRQGAQVRLQISGVGLAGGTAMVGIFPTTVVDDRDATRLIVDLVVPHAVLRGDRTLVVSTPQGEARFENAIYVTGIAASPRGDDVTGRGTYDAPFRTVTRAVGASDYLDFIDLDDGEYDTGDTSPLWIKEFAVLAGTSRSGTILHVTGRYPVQVDGEIANLTIAGLGANTSACVTGKPSVVAVRIEGCIVGLSVQWAAIHDVVFRNVQNGVFADVPDGQALSIDGVDIELTPPSPPGPARGMWLVAGAGATMVLDHSSIDAGGGMGLEVSGKPEGSVKVRRTHVRGGIGIYVPDTMSLDLGTSTDPGQNTVDAGDRAVLDARPALAGPFGTIMTLSGTVLNGMAFEAGTVVTGPVTNPPYFEIRSANNRLSF